MPNGRDRAEQSVLLHGESVQMIVGRMSEWLWGELATIAPLEETAEAPDLWPCRVVLKDGRLFDRVLFIEVTDPDVAADLSDPGERDPAAEYRELLEAIGDRWPEVDPTGEQRKIIEEYLAHPEKFVLAEDAYDDDRPKHEYLDVEQIVRISESPDRLPVAVSRKLLDAGETGMGYYCFELTVEDGRRLTVFSQSFPCFVDLPDEIRPNMIVDGAPLARGMTEFDCGELPYATCLFLPPDAPRR